MTAQGCPIINPTWSASRGGSEDMFEQTTLSRRSFLGWGAAGLAGLALGREPAPAAAQEPDARPVQFQIACMTLPYSQFPLQRALSGIKTAGYQHVAWGTTHVDKGGVETPILGGDAAAGRARELGKRCRDLGLEPLMMFSGI